MNKNKRAGRPIMVCLCGSVRFANVFQQANRQETRAGRIVLTIEMDDGEQPDGLKQHKISMVDELLVLNVDGYIGQATRRMIAYGRRMGKRIRWWESSACGDETEQEVAV